MVSLGCSKDESSDSGGAGADFDASQYYTKSEIDGMLKDVVQENTSQQYVSIGNTNDIGYNYAKTLTVPKDSNAVLVKIFV